MQKKSSSSHADVSNTGASMLAPSIPATTRVEVESCGKRQRNPLYGSMLAGSYYHIIYYTSLELIVQRQQENIVEGGALTVLKHWH